MERSGELRLATAPSLVGHGLACADAETRFGSADGSNASLAD